MFAVYLREIDSLINRTHEPMHFNVKEILNELPFALAQQSDELLIRSHCP